MPPKVKLFKLIGPIVEEDWIESAITNKDFTELFDYLEASVNNRAHILLSSPGGDLFFAFRMVDMLAPHREKITIECAGLVASAGSLFAAGVGGEVLGRPNVSVMLHNPKTFTHGGIKEHQTAVNLLSTMTEQAAEVYAKKLNKKIDEVKTLMAEETWWSAKQAQENNFIDKLLEQEDTADNEAIMSYGTYEEMYAKKVQEKALKKEIEKNIIKMSAKSEEEPVYLSTGIGSNTITFNSTDSNDKVPDNGTSNNEDIGGKDMSEESVPQPVDKPTLPVETNNPVLEQKVQELTMAVELLREQNRKLHEAHDMQVKFAVQERNKEALDEAVRTGRITPAEVKLWEERLEKGGDLVRNILMELKPSDYFLETGSPYAIDSLEAVPVNIVNDLKAQNYSNEEIVAAYNAEKGHLNGSIN